MEYVSGLSYLKQWWGVQAAVYGGATVARLVSGTHVSKTSNHIDTDAKLSVFQFRRRLPVYLSLGLATLSWAGWNVFSIYLWGGAPNSVLQTLVSAVGSPGSYSSTGSTRVLLTLTLFEVHLIRRLYESLKVQILSRKQVLNPLDKLLSLLFYPAAALSLVADLFPLTQHTPLLSLSALRPLDVAAVAVFVVASFVSKETFAQLAKLRRNRFGHITHTSYKLPRGPLFSQVSCPHYLAEILVYASLAAILKNGGSGSTCCWLLGCVASTQVYLGHNTHQWYREKFEKDMPSSQKRIVPFLF